MDNSLSQVVSWRLVEALVPYPKGVDIHILSVGWKGAEKERSIFFSTLMLKGIKLKSVALPTISSTSYIKPRVNKKYKKWTGLSPSLQSLLVITCCWHYAAEKQQIKVSEKCLQFGCLSTLAAFIVWWNILLFSPLTIIFCCLYFPILSSLPVFICPENVKIEA